MADVFTRAKRSAVMALIRSRGEPGSGTPPHRFDAWAWHHRLAPERSRFRQARLRLLRGEACCVCGRLLLAQLSAARDEAGQQWHLLEGKARAKRPARPHGVSHPARKGLDGLADLGVPFGTVARSRPDSAPRSCPGSVEGRSRSQGTCRKASVTCYTVSAAGWTHGAR